MSYTLFLHSLEQKRDEDGHTGCYRDDAVRALAQEDLSSLLNKNQGQDKLKGHAMTRNRLEELNQLLHSSSQPDFSASDAACSLQSFDVKYTSAVERCNLFLIQKQLASLNTQAARVDVAARLTGIETKDIKPDALSAPENQILLKELDTFKKLSINIAGLLAFDISRQERSEHLQTSIQQIGVKARDILNALSPLQQDLKREADDLKQVNTGIRNGT
ncbi:hypothetical protein [Undibacterium umbellatum]|uniref:Uncharacterized protein n=1 Tax=Undibacterium umbellatum TaxID=2762300 RepID=A0ABR6ZGA9_9BURK|nr:hypothetical protein [Undibacterium umbellatum]MBC3910761.1 hypothetical protein [Undibacterium umbellatum]